MKVLIKNGKIITPHGIIDGDVTFEGNKIVHVGAPEQDKSFDQIIDAEGLYVSPGFIDIHTHGAGGYDCMDGTVEAILGLAKSHSQFGTTSLIPTTLTSTFEDLVTTLDNFTLAKNQNTQGAELLGLHLEGPYFSIEQRGAQDPRYIKSPDPEEYMRILSQSNDIVRWTIAPELDGACDMAVQLKSQGIVASMGHSNATYQEVLRGYESGFSLITHFYSGMSTVSRRNAYRYAGMVEAGYLIDDLYIEIIADGKHLPESLLKLIYKVKGPDTICLVTDSMRAAGMGEGEFILGSLNHGQKVIVEDGVAKLPDRSAFAGSVATANRVVRTMMELAEIPLYEAVKMMSLNPAKVMNLDNKKGSLTPGKDADIIIFDENISVKGVIIGGRVLQSL